MWISRISNSTLYDALVIVRHLQRLLSRQACQVPVCIELKRLTSCATTMSGQHKRIIICYPALDVR